MRVFAALVRRQSISVAVVGLIVLLLAGCGPKNFTPDDFRAVEKGMTEEQVRERLGGPSHTDSHPDGKNCWYSVSHNYYLVWLRDGKVANAQQFTSKEEYEAVRQMARMMAK